ncbi:MAG: sensor histidine kinase [Actinomycetota bacterium]
MIGRGAILWKRTPLLGRLLVTAGLGLMVAEAVMLGISARQDAEDARTDLQEELKTQLVVLPPALAEYVVVGDFATLKQTLDRVAGDTRIAEVYYIDQSGVMLRSIDAPPPANVPGWFRHLLGIGDITGTAPVTVGGRPYGELTVVLSAQAQIAHIFAQLVYHLGALLAALAVGFAAMWQVLRNGLRPLTELEAAARAIADGDLSVRLAEAGSPELRSVIVAFNQMAEATGIARHRLEFSNTELVRLTEVTAHHLQEPSRRLVTFSRRLRTALGEQALPEDAAASLTYIEQQAGRLRALIRDIQLYLAVDQSNDEIAPQSVAVAMGLVLAEKGRREQLEAIGAEVTLASTLPEVALERRRLVNVFDILLDNAIRYRRPDVPLHVHVSADWTAGVIRLRFADNGRGIEPEYRQQVFRMFERLHPMPGDDSTGVGLAIVQRIVEHAGGRAWIEETEGGGATVVLQLPTGVP